MPELVAIDGPGGPRFVELITAVWERGDAFCPIDPRLSGPARRRVLDALGPTMMVTTDGDGSPQRLHGGAPVERGVALVIATSGTSGEPKAAIHTHRSIEASARSTSLALDVDAGRDHWLACLPLAHIGGLSVVLRSLITGTTLTVHDGFAADAVMAAADRGVTLVSLVTRALNQVPAHRFRKILIGGAAPPGDLPANVVPTYGMTETGSGVIYGQQILPGCQIGLIDNAGNAVDKPGHTGQILVSGKMVFRAYRNHPSPFIDGGWFPTGDLGHWNPNGTLTVEGRAADVIVTGGEKVWPDPVEKVLAADPSIDEVALIGVPDIEWGHRVVAVVVPTNPDMAPTIDRIRALVAEQFPPWYRPKELVIRLEPLPRTSLGKLRRRHLAESDPSES